MRIRRYKGGRLLPRYSLCLKPDEVRTVTLDLQGEIGSATIATATWESSPSGLTLGTPTNTGQATEASVTAPSTAGRYRLVITTTTASETIETRIPVTVGEPIETE